MRLDICLGLSSLDILNRVFCPSPSPSSERAGWVSMQTGLDILNCVFWFCLPGYWYGCCCSCRTCRARRIYITWLDLVKKMLCRAGCMLLTWGWTWICWIEPFAPTHENTQGWISTISPNVGYRCYFPLDYPTQTSWSGPFAPTPSPGNPLGPAG